MASLPENTFPSGAGFNSSGGTVGRVYCGEVDGPRGGTLRPGVVYVAVRGVETGLEALPPFGVSDCGSKGGRLFKTCFGVPIWEGRILTVSIESVGGLGSGRNGRGALTIGVAPTFSAPSKVE